MFVQQLLGYLSSLPDTVNIGIIWGLMALGVFITYKVLDIADLTVDGSFIVGGVVCAVYMDNGGNFAVGLLLGFVSGVLCGLITGLLHALLGIPAILAGILTQLSCRTERQHHHDGGNHQHARNDGQTDAHTIFATIQNRIEETHEHTSFALEGDLLLVARLF